MYNKYRFSVSDYHAVASADIIIDGITVLAGINGSGKSTLSRWLYYIVNATRSLEDYAYQECTARIRQLLQEAMEVVGNGMAYYRNQQAGGRQRIDFMDLQRSHTHWIRLVERRAEIDEVREATESLLAKMGERLMDYLQNAQPGPRRERVYSVLHLEQSANCPIEQIVEDFKEKRRRMISRYISNMHDNIDKRPKDLLIKSIKDNYQEADAFPENLQLHEDGAELIDNDTISVLFNLSKAVYIDTPMALTSSDPYNVVWKELRKISMSESMELETRQKLILRRIKRILGGESRIVDDSGLFSHKELHYVSDDGKIDIGVEKAATGFKTFIYLQRLVECGYLDNKTLLLIDEPEAHLHPQWIVEYARLLVLLHKTLGLKIIVATHNPDMVAALRAVAERESVLDKTHFYLSTPRSGSDQYEFEDLGGEIGKIFESFNIALTRIEQYGCSSI